MGDFRPWNKYDYFVWLCKKVDACEEFGIMEKLHDRQYTWKENGNIFRDENREIAGRMLRRNFLCEKAVPNIFGDIDVPASVLEVLVALAEDIDDSLAGDGSGERIGKWFHEMLGNLGILEAENFDEIDYILDRWLDRQFRWDGEGSPFPIHKGCKFDQRKVELWLQACGYYSQELR